MAKVQLIWSTNTFLQYAQRHTQGHGRILEIIKSCILVRGLYRLRLRSLDRASFNTVDCTDTKQTDVWHWHRIRTFEWDINKSKMKVGKSCDVEKVGRQYFLINLRGFLFMVGLWNERLLVTYRAAGAHKKLISAAQLFQVECLWYVAHACMSGAFQSEFICSFISACHRIFPLSV